MRYVAVDDVGRAVNPMIVDGQTMGAVAQGLGQALFERCVYDRGSGQLLSGSLMDYSLPRAADLPNIETWLDDTPTRTNALGVKGAGEAGTVAAPCAAISAVLDALAPLGVTTSTCRRRPVACGPRSSRHGAPTTADLEAHSARLLFESRQRRILAA